MTWFTLFFIPVFPYEIKYFLTCPICQYGVKLDRAQIDEIKPLAEANQLLVDGKITKEEYQAKINLLNGNSPQQIEAPAKSIEVEHKVLNDAAALSFCADCGKELTKEIKFCGNCGVQVSNTK